MTTASAFAIVDSVRLEELGVDYFASMMTTTSIMPPEEPLQPPLRTPAKWGYNGIMEDWQNLVSKACPGARE